MKIPYSNYDNSKNIFIGIFVIVSLKRRKTKPSVHTSECLLSRYLVKNARITA